MPQTIEREAKLFEAGSYPDRGIEVTEADLDRIAANTSEAPVRIEHTDTPFDGALGVLRAVYRKGRDLIGRLCFTAEAWELIKSANARRLSVAITRDKNSIAEVSLVREPRVADAAVFKADDSIRVPGSEIELGTNDDTARLQMELREVRVDADIDRLKRSGKLTPASEQFARAILMADDSNLITFGDGAEPLASIFLRFLESQPKLIEFAELAPAGPAEDEPELFARLGITSSQVEKHRGR